MDELLENRDLLTQLAGDLTITGADAKDLLAALPEDLSPERRVVIEKALSLVGKVTYFWGGKSYIIGWDSRWGRIQKVTAEARQVSTPIAQRSHGTRRSPATSYFIPRTAMSGSSETGMKPETS